ncbi:MAG: aminotransferase class I/II-fold pyridoxal phosphate-dependent enzyme [Actinobacteria bacterium]|jgi:aspartate/methionine/tyrosine aminotransferase|nr:MAG: aminotransferase class I/II-fold pyridoxal phosphate-dependent enzyme [Actinomycetota bacterium]
MRIRPFRLERYFAVREFGAQYSLASSDCESLVQAELLAMADGECLGLWEGLSLGYTETPGAPFLRCEIAGLYDGIDPEYVLVTVPVEGIFIAMNSILDRGDHVICTFPGYQALYEVAVAIGCEVERWTAQEERGWRFDPDWLHERVRPETRLIAVNFPHNPTGFLPGREDFEHMVATARSCGAYFFSDEMYRHLELEPERRLPPACDLYDRAVSLGGMSKSFGMPGVRIGWLATRDRELLARMAGLKDYTTICASAPSEVLATIALRCRERIIARNLALIQANLELLRGFFARRGVMFAWNEPSAGTVAFPRMLAHGDADGFCDDMYAKAGVMLLPASAFEYGDRHFRIGFGRRNMPEALATFEEHLPDTGV